jgi:hypothetical protein
MDGTSSYVDVWMCGCVDGGTQWSRKGKGVAYRKAWGENSERLGKNWIPPFQKSLCGCSVAGLAYRHDQPLSGALYRICDIGKEHI